MKAYSRQQSVADETRDRLIAEHLEAARRIALHVARRVPDWVSREDLISAGMLGLAEAAGRFDESRGEPFLAFAAKRIRGAVFDELRRGDIMPRRVRQMSREVGKAIRDLEQSLGRTPEDAEVAAALGVPLEQYQDDLEHLVHLQVVELDDVNAGSASEPSESPQAQAERGQILKRVASALQRLDQRDVLILNLHYEEELTYAEIGEVLNVTTSRVCQLHGRAVARLKAEIESLSTESTYG